MSARRRRDTGTARAVAAAPRRAPTPPSTDESSDDEVFDLALDDHGRVVATSDCGLDFTTRVFELALAAPKSGQALGQAVVEETVIKDCDEVPSLECPPFYRLFDPCLLKVFDGCTTFWLPADQAPRCSLESMAKAVFELHTKDTVYDPATSGCEWWVQVRKPFSFVPGLVVRRSTHKRPKRFATRPPSGPPWPLT
jgi:hypothetical protein